MSSRSFILGLSLVLVLGIPLRGKAQDKEASTPSVEQIFAMRKLPEPLVPRGGIATDEASRRLISALSAFEARQKPDDFSALAQFLSANPGSPWRMAVETNLGLLYYRAGYFSKCLPAFRDAWKTGKDDTEPKAKALTDRAAGEYAKMLSRLGRYQELKAFLAEVQGREFHGQSTELILAGREGAATMEKRPEISFRCGSMALSRILASQGSPLWGSADIVNSQSTMQGISLADVAALSRKLGMNYQPAKRSPGAALITPSVIHWKVGHYAALMKKVGDRYLTKDPTFDSETWHTLDALEAEASGYFLVPPGPLPNGWIAVGGDEARKIYGKGLPEGSNPDGTSPCDPSAQNSAKDAAAAGSAGDAAKDAAAAAASTGDASAGCCGDPGGDSGGGDGMAVYAFHLMLASLRIVDSPVGYRPPFGYPVRFTVMYAQREASQPSNFNYSNLGSKVNFNWLTYITDDPNNPATASQATAGGGTIQYSYSGVSGGNHVFAPQFDTFKQLSRSTSGLPYTVVNQDGSQEIYGQSDGSTVAPRKVFLTQRIDPSGNATTLTYDAQLRITAITDALGQQTVFTYNQPGDPYKITQVTDPFGRFAIFSYDGSGRLIQIQDVIGIRSTFTYDGTGDFINSLTTPYGTTTFTTFTQGLLRRLSATDPAGDTEVLETNGDMTQSIPFSDASAPQGLSAAGRMNQYLYYRNSFFWNKKQWKEFPNDHIQAHLYHWLHDQNVTQMSRYLESEKKPLQSRVWYAYPGQSDYITVGTQTTPSGTGRVIEGGSQLSFQSLNTLGLATSAIDPLGRTTNYQYDTNNIDLLSMSQVINGAAPSSVTLASYTYNAQHLPLTVTDAAGQTTINTYNARGQITSLTDAKGETTTTTYYTADAAGHQRNGRVYQVIGPLAGNTAVTTLDYDTVGRVSSLTGPDGYFLTFSYDVLDRLTQMTYPDGTSEQTTYLALDPQTRGDRLGRITTYVYNSLRQLQSVTDPANRTVQYRWCRCGALSQIIDAMGRVTAFRRDAASRVTAKRFADGSVITYGYEPLSGRLSTTTDEKGQVKTSSYNLDNTPASTAYTNALVATPNVSYTYDANFQRMTSMTDGAGVTSYSYYPIAAGTLGAGQLATETSPFPNATAALTYTYDELGRAIGYAINGIGETRSFDSMGRIQSVANSLGSFAYSYVGATSRMDTVTYPNGVSCAYTYQPLTGDFRLQNISHTLPGNNLLSQHSYQYNTVGDITRWTQVFAQGGLNRSWLCGYDNADQLTSVMSQDPGSFTNLPTGQYTYSYDPAGNRLSETLDGNSTTASFNALNQSGTLSGADASVLPAQTYEWDAENRLSAINYMGTSQRSQFQYDGRGRRVRITELKGGIVTADTWYAWRGLDRCEARDSTGGIVKKRYYNLGMQELTGATPGSYYYLRDHLGSIHAMTDATGAIRAGYDYDAYGRRTKVTGALDTDEGFTGLFNHSPSGLALAVFRAHNPNLGRWISRDPIAERGGLNLYAYVANSPINAVDPLGLDNGRPPPPPPPASSPSPPPACPTRSKRQRMAEWRSTIIYPGPIPWAPTSGMPEGYTYEGTGLRVQGGALAPLNQDQYAGITNR